MRYEVVEKRRWETWEREFARFDELSIDDLKTRCTCEDWSALRLRDVMRRYGCAADRSKVLAARDRKFAVLSVAEQQARLAVDGCSLRQRPQRDDRKLVTSRLLVLQGGSVSLALKPARRREYTGSSKAAKVAKAVVKEVLANEHEIESILEEREVRGKRGRVRREFRVRWRGYHASWEAWRISGAVGSPIETWEPHTNVESTQALIDWDAVKEVVAMDVEPQQLAEQAGDATMGVLSPLPTRPGTPVPTAVSANQQERSACEQQRTRHCSWRSSLPKPTPRPRASSAPCPGCRRRRWRVLGDAPVRPEADAPPPTPEVSWDAARTSRSPPPRTPFSSRDPPPCRSPSRCPRTPFSVFVLGPAREMGSSGLRGPSKPRRRTREMT